jgi:hypothetical protein
MPSFRFPEQAATPMRRQFEAKMFGTKKGRECQLNEPFGFNAGNRLFLWFFWMGETFAVCFLIIGAFFCDFRGFLLFLLIKFGG